MKYVKCGLLNAVNEKNHTLLTNFWQILAFMLSLINQKVYVVEKQMIPHLKVPVDGY